MNTNNIQKNHVCVCGREFKSSQALIGHYSHCLIHKDDLYQKQLKEREEKESRRLPNGKFKCENPKCQKEHDGTYGSGRFCSKKCRNSFNTHQSNLRKIKNGTFRCNFNSRKDNYGRSPYGTWKCKLCGVIFETKHQLRQHIKSSHSHEKRHSWNFGLTKETDKRIAVASIKISTSLSGKCVSPIWTDERRVKMSATCKKNKKSGGYRKNGGKGIRGWYKGYWCDSSWELAYVIYNLEHNIHFIRNTKGFNYKFEGIIRQYHPDFLLDDGTYVEIKGWYDNKTLTKHETFRSLGYKLIVIDKENINQYLDYAIQKYGKNFTSLYEKTK